MSVRLLELVEDRLAEAAIAHVESQGALIFVCGDTLAVVGNGVKQTKEMFAELHLYSQAVKRVLGRR